MATKKQFSMDGLIEQMLDGLFRMAEKVTRAPYRPHPRPLIPEQGSPTRGLSKGRGEWNEPGTEEGIQPAIVKSEESKEFTIHNSQLTADCSDPQAIPEQARLPVAFPNLGGSAKEVPVRKRRRQRVKMVEGTLFE